MKLLDKETLELADVVSSVLEAKKEKCSCGSCANPMTESDPCWKGYKQIGTKKKNGKEVPNCVPEKKEN